MLHILRFSSKDYISLRGKTQAKIPYTHDPFADDAGGAFRGYEARGARASRAVPRGVPLQAPRPIHPEVQRGRFRERMFLAPARLQVYEPSQEQSGVLEREIREQRGARREDGLEALAHGVPRGDGLGMFRQERFCPHGGAPCCIYPGRRGVCRNLAPRKNYN